MKKVYTQPFAGCGAIIEKDGKVLLVKEGSTSPDPGKWNQPCGWIDLGEDPIAAVKREVKEETGLEFEPTGLVGIYSLDKNRPDGTHHVIKLIFLGRVSGNVNQASNEEINEIGWFTQSQIEKMDLQTLRDLDIKQEVRDYFAGKNYPLDIIHHAVQK